MLPLDDIKNTETPAMPNDMAETINAKTKRKNNPLQLRHTLLMCAKDIMLSDGVVELSMQKVADKAEVSKGGLFHHFKSKDELLQAVIELFVAQINTAILQYMTEHGDKKGAFSRAYVAVFCENTEIGLASDWAGLIRAINSDATLGKVWQEWQNSKLKQFAHSDGDAKFAVVRYAIDGAWQNRVDVDYLPLLKTQLFALIDDLAK